jgi:excisionase family DNA binding protein
MTPSFITVEDLAAVTGLPRAWLRAEADAGRLPCVRAGRRRMFDLDAVVRELNSRAERKAVPNA